MIKPLTHPPETPLFPVFQDDFRSCLHLLPPKKDSISFFLLSISFLHLSIQLFFLLYLGDRCAYRLVSCYHGYHCIHLYIYESRSKKKRGKKKSLNITRRKTSKLSMATALLITWDFSYLFLLFLLAAFSHSSRSFS